MFEKRDFFVLTGKTFPHTVWTTPWLMLIGDTGSGKTTLAMRYLEHWDGNEFVDVREFESLLRHSQDDPTEINRCLDHMIRWPRLVIDDLGSENTAKIMNYGTEWEVREELKKVLYARYDARLRTVITTNLTPEQLESEKYYGSKLYSRMREIATVYRMIGDRRKGELPTCECAHRAKVKSDIPLIVERRDIAEEKYVAEQQKADTKDMTERQKKIGRVFYRYLTEKIDKKQRDAALREFNAGGVGELTKGGL